MDCQKCLDQIKKIHKSLIMMSKQFVSIEECEKDGVNVVDELKSCSNKVIILSNKLEDVVRKMNRHVEKDHAFCIKDI